MASEESSRRAPILSMALSNILNLAALILIIAVGYLAWPMIVAQLTAGTPAQEYAPAPADVRTQPRPAAPRVIPAPRPIVEEPAQAIPTPVPGVYDTQAEADAAYKAAVEAGERNAELNAAPLPNGSKITNEAPPNAPAYDPSVPEVKYEGVPNPGAGQCLHGQVFTDKGCKNPGNGSKESK